MPGGAAKRSLLDEDEGNEGLGQIRVNTEYAKRFEHNKRREELHRLQEKHPDIAVKLSVQASKGGGKGEEEDASSSEDDDDDGDLPDEVEAKIFDTLLKIRRKDPVIYQKDVQFFEEPDEEGEAQEGDRNAVASSGKKRTRPQLLKDVMAKQMLEHGPEASSSEGEEEEEDDDDAGGGSGKRQRAERKAAAKKPKAYDAEQEGLRKAFLQAAADAEEGLGGEGAAGFGAGVLKARPSRLAAAGGSSGSDEEGDAGRPAGPKAKKKRQGRGGSPAVEQLLDAYFGAGEGQGMDERDRFLRDFIAKKAWMDQGEDVPRYGQVVGGQDDGQADVDVDEDEAYLEQADRFEANYNFRFEEPGGAQIVGHPRRVEDAFRKEDNKRAAARKERSARKAEEEERRRQEVRRLKGLKKKEIEDRLLRVQRVAGAAAPGEDAVSQLLEGEFDPEAWDQQMAAAFGDDYYDAEAEDGSVGSGELDSDLEEELGGLGTNEAGFAAVRQKLLGKKPGRGKGDDAGPQEAAEDDEEEAEEAEEEADPAAAAADRAALQRALEEYYKLDYEDVAGGVQCRFRYRPVAPDTFGLTGWDILSHSDKELNQVVGLKKLAPYREDAKKVRPNYKALQELTAARGQGQEAGRPGWWKAPGGKRADKPWAKKGDKRKREGDGKRAEGGKRARQAEAEAGGGAASGSAGGAPAESKQNKPPKPAATVAAPKVADPESAAREARLASYAKPGLKPKPGGKGGSSGSKPKGSQGPPKQQQAPASAGQTQIPDGLTKAQRKNLKRAAKRAQQRGLAAGSSGAGANARQHAAE